MPTLGQDNFSSGWTPSDNELQGDPNGLLRMDNLQLDERGAITLTRGMTKQSQLFTKPVQSIFSKTLNNKKIRYVGIGDSSIAQSGEFLRDIGATKTFTAFPGGGSIHPTEHAYTSAMNYVIIASSTTKKKDDGTDIRDLGIETPDGIILTQVEPKQILDVSGTRENYELLEGTGLVVSTENRLEWSTSGTTGRGIVQLVESIDAGTFPDGSTNSDEDLFKFEAQIGDSSKLTGARVEFLLVPPVQDSIDPVSDYYFIQFPATDTQWNLGVNVWSILQVKRGDFTKIGNNSNLDWNNIIGIRVTFFTSSAIFVAFRSLIFEGGTGQLNGRYQYLQVNVHNDNGRLSPSPVSVKSLEIIAESQSITVLIIIPTKWFQSPTEVNEIWIYRRNLDTQSVFYFVARRLDISNFVDDVSDRDAVFGIDDLPDFAHHKANFFRIHPPDNIVMMEGMYYDRISFMTSDKLFLSEAKNIDAVDSRHIFDVSGQRSEKNLWIKKIPGTGLLLGTTNDIYELRGTGIVLEDGTIDFSITPLGVSNPPISAAICSQDNFIVYMSNDGWRALTGTGSENITGHTHLLYNEQDRFGIEAVFIGTNNLVQYDCAVSKGKLFTVITLKDGVNRRCYVYDFKKRAWYPYFINPVVLFTEEDGTILGGFGDASNFFLREIDTTNLLDGTTQQDIDFRTRYIDGGTPNTRKDVQVVKIFADTLDSLVNIKIAKDGGTVVEDFGNHRFNGPTLLTLAPNTNKLLGINLGKTFQLRITDATSGVLAFTFLYWSIDYDSRPEQLNVVRIPPTNFGTAGRKRFYDLPFSINPLGNLTYKCTPILDGIQQPSLARTFIGNKDEKETQSIAFKSEIIGFELGIEVKVISPTNGVFELHELIRPRAIEILPDRQRFLRIIPTDLGNPSRKKVTRLALIIDTFGFSVTFTPLVDEIEYPSVTILTNNRLPFIYYFKEDVRGILIGGTLETTQDRHFEFHKIDIQNSLFQVLPLPAQFIRGETDYGTAARKRFSRISFICNFRGSTGKFSPVLDGSKQPVVSYTGIRKQTFDYFFLVDTIFRDLEYELDSSDNNLPFEFYGIFKPEILEILPEPLKFYKIPNTNLGTVNRKRFIIYAIIIDTRGHDVKLTPIVDSIKQPSSTINTAGKITAFHFFTTNVEGVDIGCELETLENTEFETYGISFDETVSEKLPPPTRRLRIPPSNFGVAGRKRIRTIPMEINTRGGTVTYTPDVDGITKTTSLHISTEKRTKLHFFETDVFGIDFGGLLTSNDPFEFYGLLTPENVQLLPVAKKFDQIGPISLDTGGWFRLFRLRVVPTGTLITWKFYLGDKEVDNGSIVVIPGIEDVYEINFNRAIKGTVARLELQSTTGEFHRIGGEVRYSDSGASTSHKKFKFTNEMAQVNRA